MGGLHYLSFMLPPLQANNLVTKCSVNAKKKGLWTNVVCLARLIFLLWSVLLSFCVVKCVIVMATCAVGASGRLSRTCPALLESIGGLKSLNLFASIFVLCCLFSGEAWPSCTIDLFYMWADVK